MISGSHRNSSDSRVIVVYGESSGPENSRILPSIVCEKFDNLADLYLDGLGIEILSEKSLKGCRNLDSLYLSHNKINEIVEGKIFKTFLKLNLIL